MSLFGPFTEEEEKRIQEAVEEDRQRRREAEIEAEINNRIANDREKCGW